MCARPTGEARDRGAEIAAAVEDLPVLPAVAARVVNLAGNPDSSAAEICDVIRTDPSLTARILRTVNSSYYGLPRRIETVAQATVMLGARDIVALALGSAAVRSLRAVGVPAADQEALWRHSAHGAVAAKETAGQFYYRVPGLAFVGGLLHDVGKIVLLQRYRAEWRAAVEKARAEAVPDWVVEQNVFGTTHALIGAALVARWKLPQPLIEAIGCHHEPARAAPEHRLIASLVHLADLLTHRRGIHGPGGRGPVGLDSAAGAALTEARMDFDETYMEKLLFDVDASILQQGPLIAALGGRTDDAT